MAPVQCSVWLACRRVRSPSTCMSAEDKEHEVRDRHTDHDDREHTVRSYLALLPSEMIVTPDLGIFDRIVLPTGNRLLPITKQLKLRLLEVANFRQKLYQFRVVHGRLTQNRSVAGATQRPTEVSSRAEGPN